ncbi:hypothetical protein [Brucella rhizosphaerae]|nr:hypothetical protein [Brucella rhizosphaerae]
MWVTVKVPNGGADALGYADRMAAVRYWVGKRGTVSVGFATALATLAYWC